MDPLTGLLNRRGLEERMSIEVNRGLRQKTPMAMAMVDIDHFKDVNDAHGHEMGDRVLAWLGSVLTRQSRGVDVAARTGGDEFAVLLPDTTAEDGRRYADRVVRAIAGPDAAAERAQYGLPDGLELTVSVGVSGTGATDAGMLMDTADKALYAAKGEGRNRVVAADLDRPQPTRV